MTGPGRLAVPHRERGLGGTETITVMIPRPVPGNWYGMEACLRPPDLLYQEAQISAMLSSVQFG